MDPVSVIAMIGTVAAVINNVAAQIMAIKQLHDQIKTADMHLMSLIAQLISIKAALAQIQDLIQSANYDKQLEMDLELSLQASLKTKNAASTLKFRSKVRVVFESDDMDACLSRLNHQATALNLLITVLTSKTVTEQKAMLQRSDTRKVFKQIQEDKDSILDDAASVHVLRDSESVRKAAIRTKSEPIISKNPWKRFGFDSRILGSKGYGGKRSSRGALGKATHQEYIPEVETKSVDDAATLVEEPESTAEQLELDIAGLTLEVPTSKAIRFSKMLAFGSADGSVSNLISHAQQLWNATEHQPSQTMSRASFVQKHRFSTRYFVVSIYAHSVNDHDRSQINEDFLSGYRDVSSILFAANLSTYRFNSIILEKDLLLFARTANDYHLWLAKIVLFLDTTELDPYGAQGMADDVANQFLEAARAGASYGRIHVITGEADEMAAGNIFAVCNETGRVQENKWAGLSRSPTC